MTPTPKTDPADLERTFTGLGIRVEMCQRFLDGGLTEDLALELANIATRIKRHISSPRAPRAPRPLPPTEAIQAVPDLPRQLPCPMCATMVDAVDGVLAGHPCGVPVPPKDGSQRRVRV